MMANSIIFYKREIVFILPINNDKIYLDKKIIICKLFGKDLECFAKSN